MRTISILCALAGLGHAAWPTQGVIFNGSAQVQGVSYRFATVVEPHVSGSDLHWGDAFGGGFKYQAGKEHRMLYDGTTHVYFGYDLGVERADSSGNCRVTISPLTLKFEDFSWPRDLGRAAYKPLSLPTYPTPQILHPGDAIALDLLVSPDGKRKVIDYIQVSCQEAADRGNTGSAAVAARSRDFSPQDLELRVVEPKITINDRRIDAPGLHGETIGNILWFYVPGKGRFLLSLIPHPNLAFRKAGTLTGSAISFQYGGDRYQVRSSEPMFRSGQSWNLYVRVDTAYQSKQGASFGSSDRPEHILTDH